MTARLSLWDTPLPPSMQRHVLVLAPQDEHPYSATEWTDALVVVEAGVIDVEATSGQRHRFAAGAVLHLTGVPVHALHNPGDHDAVIVAVRRRTDSFPAAVPSHR